MYVSVLCSFIYTVFKITVLSACVIQDQFEQSVYRNTLNSLYIFVESPKPHMKKAFTLIELLLVVTLLLGLATAVVVSMNGASDRERYNHSKEQFKNYLTYTKYKAVDTQTNASVSINVENNSVSSPFDYEIEWLMDFTDDLIILDSSDTNILFNLDGSLNSDIYVDVASKDGAYSNRLHLSPIGLFRYGDVDTNVVVEQ